MNYLVDMHDQRKRKRIFHVNMLWEFHMPKMFDVGYWAEEVSSEDLEGDIRAPSVQGDAFWVAGCPCNISTYDGQTG